MSSCLYYTAGSPLVYSFRPEKQPDSTLYPGVLGRTMLRVVVFVLSFPAGEATGLHVAFAVRQGHLVVVLQYPCHPYDPGENT